MPSQPWRSVTGAPPPRVKATDTRVGRPATAAGAVTSASMPATWRTPAPGAAGVAGAAGPATSNAVRATWWPPSPARSISAKTP